MIIPIVVCFLQSLAFAHLEDPHHDVATEKLLVTGTNQQKSKTHLNQKSLVQSSAQNFSDILSNQVGVQTQTFCSNCGAKRLSINGFKGEHSTITIDGVPLVSSSASFYGLDTISLSSISEIIIKRGSGENLSSYESLAGSVNVVTIDPFDSTNSIKAQLNIKDKAFKSQETYSGLSSFSILENSWAVAVGGDWNSINNWDTDNNNVSEYPFKDNYNLFLKSSLRLNSADTFNLRFSKSKIDIIGGNTKKFRQNTVPTILAEYSDFEDGDVNKKYLSSFDKITDYVKIDRLEAQYDYHKSLTGYDLNIKGGYAQQKMGAIYSHGFDYANIDDLYIFDLSLNSLVFDSHFINLGFFARFEDLRSTSTELYESRGIKNDNFTQLSYSFYADDTWEISDKWELHSALRLEQTDINWWFLKKSIKELMFIPRILLENKVTDFVSQQFSYGLGYRTPQTFLESQHGSNEHGFEVALNKVEKAHTFAYGLSFNTPTSYITSGLQYSSLHNLAYAKENGNQPLQYVNSTNSNDIFVSELLIGHKILPNWFLELSYEHFNFDSDYKRKLPTANIEDRIQIKSKFDLGKFSHILGLVIIPARNISNYANYNNNYNKLTFTGLSEEVSLPKKSKSPTYATIDSSIAYTFENESSIYLGINNIFNYTQTRFGDSPLSWQKHGDHAHLDMLHNWGPNRGREFYLKANIIF